MALIYKGIEFKVLQRTTPHEWAWSFQLPHGLPVQGILKGSRDIAIAVVQKAIERKLRQRPELTRLKRRNKPSN